MAQTATKCVNARPGTRDLSSPTDPVIDWYDRDALSKTITLIRIEVTDLWRTIHRTKNGVQTFEFGGSFRLKLQDHVHSDAVWADPHQWYHSDPYTRTCKMSRQGAIFAKGGQPTDGDATSKCA